MRTIDPTSLTIHSAVKRFLGARFDSVVAPYMAHFEHRLRQSTGDVSTIRDAWLVEAENEGASATERSLITAAAIEVANRQRHRSGDGAVRSPEKVQDTA